MNTLAFEDFSADAAKSSLIVSGGLPSLAFGLEALPARVGFVRPVNLAVIFHGSACPYRMIKPPFFAVS